MKKLIHQHTLYYVIAAVIQLTGLIIVTLLSGNTDMQMAVIVLMTVLFTLWAILHHYFHHDLHPKIVMEYSLLGALGISIAFFVLQ